jgi:hypothetical protein
VTAEIAVANRAAVALAADSAAALDLPSGVKVFNTMTKLFTLSRRHPVGVMVYGSAEVAGIPWETAIKAYRESAGDEWLTELPAYGEALLGFFETSPLITSEMRETMFSRAATGLAGDMQRAIEQRDASQQGARELRRAIRDVVQAVVDDVESAALVGDLDRAAEQRWRRQHRPIAAAVAQRVLGHLPLTKTNLALVERALLACGTRDIDHAALTGVVVAGFGHGDVFPRVMGYTLHGFAGPHLLRSGVEHGPVTTDVPGIIVPIAQRDMVDAFLTGVHPTVETLIDAELARIRQALPGQIRRALALTQLPGRLDVRVVQRALEEQLATGLTHLRQAVDSTRDERLIRPILDSVGALPKDELAAMAESLVNLTSFRRRVASDEAETVGGDIDVLVISRGDGPIWIKRKHYFEADLNPDYFARAGNQRPIAAR